MGFQQLYTERQINNILSKYSTTRYVDNNIDYLFKAIDQVFLGVTPVLNVLLDDYVIGKTALFVNNDYPLNILSGKPYVLTAKITYTDKTVNVVELSNIAEISGAITTLQLVGPDDAFELNICNGAQYISNKLTAVDGKSCIVSNGLASNIESIELITLYQASANLIKSPVDITISTGESTEYPFIDYKLDIDLTKLYDVELVYKLNGEEVTQTFRGMFRDGEAEIEIADIQMGTLFVANQYETEFGNAETDAGFMLMIYNGVKLNTESDILIAGDYCTVLAEGTSETVSTIFTDIKLTKITESEIPAFENPVITNAKELLSHIPMQHPDEMAGGMMYRSNMSIEPGTTYDVTISFVAGGNEYVYKRENTLPVNMLNSTEFDQSDVESAQTEYYPPAPIKYIFAFDGDAVSIDTEENTEPLTENGYFRFEGTLMVAKDNTLAFSVGSFRGRDSGSEAKYENKLPTEIKFNFTKNFTIPTKDFAGWPLTLELTKMTPIDSSYLFNYNGTFGMKPLTCYKLLINAEGTDGLPIAVYKYPTPAGDIYNGEFSVLSLYIYVYDHASVLNGPEYSENNCGIIIDYSGSVEVQDLPFYGLTEATEEEIFSDGDYALPLTIAKELSTYKGPIGLEENKLYTVSTSDGDKYAFSEKNNDERGEYLKISPYGDGGGRLYISDNAVNWGNTHFSDPPMQHRNGVAIGKTGSTGSTVLTINSITGQDIPTIGNTMEFPLTFENVPETYNYMAYNTIGEFSYKDRNRYKIEYTIDGTAKTVEEDFYVHPDDSYMDILSSYSDGVGIEVWFDKAAYTYNTEKDPITATMPGYCYWTVSVQKPEGSDGTTKHTVVLNNITRVN